MTSEKVVMDFPRRIFTTSRKTTYSYIYLRASSSSPSLSDPRSRGISEVEESKGGNGSGEESEKRGTTKSPILFLHGFPSIALDFYPQIEHLHRLGYDIVAPDLLGYGGSTVQVESADVITEIYRQKQVVQDLTELLDSCDIETVSGVSHDFGAQLLTRLEFYHPSRVDKLIFLTVGPTLTGQEFDLDAVNAMTREALGYEGFGYQEFLTRDPNATRLLAEHHSTFHDLVFTADHELWKDHFCRVGGLKKWLLQPQRDNGKSKNTVHGYTPELADAHEKAFGMKEGGGYEGAKNWYLGFVNNVNTADDRRRLFELLSARPDDNDSNDNTDIGREEGGGGENPTNHKFPTGKKILLVSAARDVIASPGMQLHMTRQCVSDPDVDLTVEEVDAGHWVGLERPDQVNRILARFLALS